MTNGVLSLAEAKRRVIELGGTYRHAPGTGELIFEHSLAGHRQRVKANRKEASASLMQWIRKVERTLAALFAALYEEPQRKPETTH